MKKRLSFIIISFMLMCLGIVGQIVIQNEVLQGEIVEKERQEVSFLNVWNGNWQVEFEKYLESNLKIREWLIPVRNQIMYSIFYTSPNSNITIGKGNNLFEKEYICFESQIYSPMSKEEVDGLISKLVAINEDLEENGKQLFIFITPSKAEVYSEDMPSNYTAIAPSDKAESTYNLFMDGLEQTDIAYYDSIPDVNMMKDSVEFSVFPKTGTHWSSVTAAICAEKLADSMEEQLEIELPEADVAYEKSEEPVAPDSDIYNLLNLLFKANEEYYRPVIEITDTNKESHTILARGGSFMGSSLYYGMIQENYFTNSYYLENTVVRCSEEDYSGTFDSYDELPIREMVENSDIILLEVNEEAIPRMSFGFIDYLLDNDILN